MWDDDVELRFDKAMQDPSDNTVTWHYAGVDKNGLSVTCLVDAKKETIRTIKYGVEADWGAMTYEDNARACLKSYLKAHQISLNAQEAKITHAMSAKNSDNGNVLFLIHWHFSFQLNGGYFSGIIKLVDGKLTVCSLSSSGNIGDQVSLFAPRWITE